MRHNQPDAKGRAFQRKEGRVLIMTWEHKAKLTTFLKKNISLLAFVILFILFSLTCNGKFLTVSNLLTIGGSAMDLLIVAMGATFIILLGSIDLSAGSMMALCGVLTAKLFAKTGSTILTLIIVMAVSMLIYLMQGLAHTRLKVPTFIVTLGFLSIARASATMISGGTNTSIPFTSSLKIYLGLKPWILIIGFGVFFICLLIEKFTLFGRYTKLVGGDEIVAKLSGLNVDKIKLKVFMFAGLLTGLGAVVMAARMGSGSPSVGDGYELDVISAVVLGGTSQRGGIGGVRGTLIGVLTLKMLANGLVLWGLSSEIQLFIKGLILIMAVFVSQERSRNMVVK
ncbi:ribose ABC transporter permease [Anaerotruncus colihominis]|uniref:ABC transporter permease n=2 Tax=Anaerotruncus colihominis TaxID=169435 RepID=A0A1Y4E7L9_9FIRM|nr:ABC transporter permease [Anaerotruncus colihominis]OUO67434.1 ribose ABC transporter permease [Anaerotruncus colihominis]OUP68119.1 ribose ABC transporter permease [Anaerotruncus colihominis]OUP72477.1 ribose ABC transporter permease [Anaerotruncus colihominis]RGE70363.1 ABC transporter permease [Anaerotruncus colihominis]